ncbi:hypothetical protein MMC26_000780 [Xylographa opegraphella]|nr:hypothetical protein [Xylographa opegraphella]
MSSSTSSTSPTPAPTGSATTPSVSASRRPPRKSTLTQQQKNQKRQRATQDQLNTLEVEFISNPTPTAAVRERIAADINMTERSVQIWFQNRRAKIKLIAKKSIETGEDCDQIPESYRSYLAAQAFDSGKPLARNFLAQSAGSMPTYGNGASMFMGGESLNPQKVVIHHFDCKNLSIGTWRRIGQNAMDLVVFYSVGERPCLTYYINNESSGYKIEFPFSYIKNITLDNSRAEGTGTRPPGLIVELNRRPNFYMDSTSCNGFYQCGDFTEDQQASQVMTHYLGGDPAKLSSQLAKLTVLESFQNRLNPWFDLGAMVPPARDFNPAAPSARNLNAIAPSAPISPVLDRPASQPTNMGPPPLNHFKEFDGFGMNLNPHMRGHKRTRSRSVPAAFDISGLRHPTPSFHVQHPSATMMNDNIFAPIPVYHQAACREPYLPTTGGDSSDIHDDLRIDTSASYGLDFRQYPMSAATTTSPSDYASPSFFAPGAHMAHMPVDSMGHGYTVAFLSPMLEHNHLTQQPVSPVSAMSHGDPVIADQSPQLSNMHRSASADFLSMGSDHQSGILDEDSMLSDMYSKQSMALPLRPAAIEDTNLEMHLNDEPSNNDFDLQSMVHFDTVDPSNLGPANGAM